MKGKLNKTALAAGIFAAGILLAFAASCGEIPEKKGETAITGEVENVSLGKAELSPIEDTYEATGTVKAKTTTDISANILGRILSINVSEGDPVKKGQILIEIDSREAETRLQKAEAGLQEARAALIEIDRSEEAAMAGEKTAETHKRLAEATFERIRELYRRKSATAQEFDEAEARLKTAGSELERARANVKTITSKRGQIAAKIEQANADIANSKVYIGYTRIASPVSGIVVRKYVEAGATASPGMPLLSVEDDSRYRLEAAVEESRSGLVRLGERVNVRIDALGETEFAGKISEVLPSSDPASRSYTVKIDLPANSDLRTGLYGLARFPISQKETLTVPQTALVTRGQLTGVFVVDQEGAAFFRIVTPGKASGGNIEILTGLSEGEQIVTAGGEKLSDGIRVR